LESLTAAITAKEKSEIEINTEVISLWPATKKHIAATRETTPINFTIKKKLFIA
jgi:hypothetical protein